jgi:hypothetical protein
MHVFDLLRYLFFSLQLFTHHIRPPPRLWIFRYIFASNYHLLFLMCDVLTIYGFQFSLDSLKPDTGGKHSPWVFGISLIHIVPLSSEMGETRIWFEITERAYHPFCFSLCVPNPSSRIHILRRSKKDKWNRQMEDERPVNVIIHSIM